MKKNKMVKNSQLRVRTDADIRAKLDRAAVSTGVSRSLIVRKALERFFMSEGVGNAS